MDVVPEVSSIRRRVGVAGRRVDGVESRVEPEATAAGTGCQPMALTALLAERSLGAARASGDADGAPPMLSCTGA